MLSDIIVMMIKKFKLTYTDSIKIILAMYILVILLSQLFTFETFPAKIADAIGGSLTAGMVFAVLLVLMELLSIPYLISMKIKPKIIKVSRAIAGVSLASLLIFELMAITRGLSLMFGTTFDLPSGSWSILLLIALIILYAWAVMAGKSSQKLTKQ